MNSNNQTLYKFGEFRLDVAERLLLRESESVSLSPKMFDVLTVLVERSGHLVEKDELLRIVWEDTFVEESNVARIVHSLRKILGENNGNKFIETVPKRGYRFVAKVDVVAAANEIPENVNLSLPVAVEKLFNTKSQISPPATDELTAPPVKKQKYTARIFLVSIGLLTVILFISLLAFRNQSNASGNSNAPKSIAVLPVKPVNSNDRDLIYEFGIAESLIFKLGSVKGLTVRPLSAIRKYSDIEQDAIAAGREQQVDYVLASNYQLANDKILVTSQLINVETGAVEKTLRSEKDSADVFLMQDAISNDFGNIISRQFGKTEISQAKQHFTTNEDAYRLYLEGMNLADNRNLKDARKAVEIFEQAIKHDPNYALAYVGLAYAHRTISMNGGNPLEEDTIAEKTIERALRLDDNLSEAHTILGEIQMSYEWNFSAAEKSFKRAIELNPNSAPAHLFYSFYLTNFERFDEAVAEAKAAIDLDPHSSFNQRGLGMVLYFARRYDEAITQLKRVVETDPNHLRSYYWISRSFDEKGDYQSAFEWFLRGETQRGSSTEELDAWRAVYAKSGWQGVLRRQIERLKQDQKKDDLRFAEVAIISAQIGDTEQAFAYLEKSYQLHDVLIVWLRVEPRLDSLRSDPRFDEFVNRVGLK
ncbi:MAG: tetratricopeptide repeat protein [Acidobacteriota bacterium]